MTRAVPTDELFRALDLDGLPRRRLLGGRLTVGTLPCIRGIAAAVLHDRSLLERQRAAGHAIEEPSVMAAHQDCFVLLDKESLEPLQRGDIEVVRWLVQQEEIRIVEQQPRETESCALTARKRRDLAVPQTGETKPAENTPYCRFEVVAARVLELMLHFGIALEELSVTASQPGFDLAHLALELPEMHGRSERMVSHGPKCAGKDLLLHETDARAASESDISGVGRFKPGRDPEQRRLADAVGTDEPDSVAVREAERDIAEHEPLAEAFRDGLDGKDAHLRTMVRQIARTSMRSRCGAFTSSSGSSISESRSRGSATDPIWLRSNQSVPPRS